MSLSGKEIALALLESIGGEGNVVDLKRCGTKLRFQLKKASQVREENIKRLNGIIGIIEADNLFYIIPETGMTLKIYNELASNISLPEIQPEIQLEKKRFADRLRDKFRRTK